MNTTTTTAAAAYSRVEQWDTHEVALHSSAVHENPFVDVQLGARLINQDSGTELQLDGFYDGDGMWRLRIMPTATGRWTFATNSNDPALDGIEGAIECVAPQHAFLRGPLLTDGFHFRHHDGSYRFVISTRLSNQFADPSTWPQVTEVLLAGGINRVLFIMGGVHGIVHELYGPGPDFSRYNVGKFQAIDRFIDHLRRHDIFASPYFYYFNDGSQRGLTLDQDRAYIRYGMARFGAYCNVLPCLSNEVDQKHTIREDAAYNPASWEWANEMGALLKERSVYGAPVTVHNPMESFSASSPGFYTILQDWQFPWAHYMMRQMQLGALGVTPELRDDIPEQTVPRGVPYGDGKRSFSGFYNPRSFARHNRLLQQLRRFGIPVINEEPGYEMQGLHADGSEHTVGSWNSQNAESLLATFWSAALAGAYCMWGNPETYELGDAGPGVGNSVVPQYLRVLQDFMSSIPYWDMEPANELVDPAAVTIEDEPFATNFCLAQRGLHYVVFATYGRDGWIDLDGGSEYSVTRLNPRTGARTALGQVQGSRHGFRLPKGEWVLHYAAQPSQSGR